MKKVLALLLCLLLSLPQLATAVCSANEITAEVADAPIITEEKIEPRIVKGYDSSNSVKERGVIYNKDKTVILGTDGTLKGDYVMPDTVKEISPKAFSGCTELTGVKVSSSVTAIAYGAFEKCTKLDRVNMPKSVWLIDEYAFSECSSLYWINFPESLVEIRSYSFYGTALKDIYLDDNIRLLGKKSFAETKAESLYIGKGVLWGNVETFANNSNLKTVYMCEGIESLDDRMFYNCNSLVEINIPNSVKTFGKGVFNGCASLQYLPLGKNQTSINEDYFRYCTSLVEIDLKGKISSIGKSAFAGCTALKKIKGYEEVYTCGEYAFDNCTSLLTLPLGRRQQEILPYTFRNCTSITELNIGPMINSIGKEAFFGCKNLSKISIANGMINIGSHVFEKTNWLDNQPAGSVYIGDNIFYCFKGNTGYRGNFKSDTVYIKEGTTAICGHAFCGGCHSNKKYVREGLTYVYIPDSVYHIGDGAFKDISPTILYAGNSDNWLYRVNKYGTWSNDSYFTKYDYVIPEGTVVTLNINGSEQLVKVGSEISLPTPKATFSSIENKGYVFDKWVAEGVTLSDPTAYVQTFTVPENDVTLTSETHIHGNVDEDTNGVVTALDILKLVKGLKASSNSEALDVNLDGKVTALDKLALHKIIKGIFDYSVFYDLYWM